MRASTNLIAEHDCCSLKGRRLFGESRFSSSIPEHCIDVRRLSLLIARSALRDLIAELHSDARHSPRTPSSRSARCVDSGGSSSPDAGGAKRHPQQDQCENLGLRMETQQRFRRHRFLCRCRAIPPAGIGQVGQSDRSIQAYQRPSVGENDLKTTRRVEDQCPTCPTCFVGMGAAHHRFPYARPAIPRLPVKSLTRRDAEGCQFRSLASMVAVRSSNPGETQRRITRDFNLA